MATGATTSRLENTLRQTGLFTDEQMRAIMESRRSKGTGITATIAHGGFADEKTFLTALAKVMSLPFVGLEEAIIADSTREVLPTKVVFQYNVIPVSIENGTLMVATNDPFDAKLIDTLRMACGMRVRIALSTSDDIAKAAKKFYGVGAETVEKMMADDRFEVDPAASVLKSDLSELDQEASIVKFVNQVIWEAYAERATDIHLEPMEDKLRVRYRVDGLLHETPLPQQLIRFQSAIISRIKVMANMDIAEKRLPQDGRIGLRIKGEDIDIRVSTMPTVYGESVSLRLLLRGKGMITIDEIGMCKEDVLLMRKLINASNGIVLVTGPTGSGKTTSLYAFLHEINSIDQRILTIEDPIEYEMGGINQVQLREEIGLTFASALRTFLRQDPDIIMVGEVRDFETAEIAIRASLTGHLVFSTLHTNDAAGAVTRLLDMGVEPFLVASAVRAVVAQRLVRKLCDACKKPVRPDEALLASAHFPVDRLKDHVIYGEAGCGQCRMTGFRGRSGIYEILRLTEDIEPLIIARDQASKIKQKAVSLGMRTLRSDGWEKVLAGFTTLDEVLRASEDNE